MKAFLVTKSGSGLRSEHSECDPHAVMNSFHDCVKGAVRYPETLIVRFTAPEVDDPRAGRTLSVTGNAKDIDQFVSDWSGVLAGFVKYRSVQ